MSLAEIEKQVIELSEEERREFAAWFYENESKIAPPPAEDDYISPEVMEELLRRRRELDSGDVQTFPVERMFSSMGKAIDAVRRPRH